MAQTTQLTITGNGSWESTCTLKINKQKTIIKTPPDHCVRQDCHKWQCGSLPLPRWLAHPLDFIKLVTRLPCASYKRVSGPSAQNAKQGFPYVKNPLRRFHCLPNHPPTLLTNLKERLLAQISRALRFSAVWKI